MNWLNNMIIDLQKKIAGSNHSHVGEQTAWNKMKEQESNERLHQFQSRLQDLDRRLIELR